MIITICGRMRVWRRVGWSFTIGIVYFHCRDPSNPPVSQDKNFAKIFSGDKIIRGFETSLVFIQQSKHWIRLEFFVHFFYPGQSCKVNAGSTWLNSSILVHDIILNDLTYMILSITIIILHQDQDIFILLNLQTCQKFQNPHWLYASLLSVQVFPRSNHPMSSTPIFRSFSQCHSYICNVIIIPACVISKVLNAYKFMLKP